MAAFEGVSHLRRPGEIGGVTWNDLVLGGSAVLEAGSWWVAFKKFRTRPHLRGYWRAFFESKDPSVFTVLAEDTAALIGLVIAFVGVFLSHRFGLAWADGVASVLIGATLAVTVTVLIAEGRKLLVGESARAETVRSIRALAEGDPAVERVGGPFTMHLGPDAILVNLRIRFKSGISPPEMTAAVDRIDQKIRSVHPRVRHVFIEARALSQAGTAGDPGSGR